MKHLAVRVAPRRGANSAIGSDFPHWEHVLVVDDIAEIYRILKLLVVLIS